MKVHKKKLKNLKLEAVSESRQRALATTSANIAVANYILTVVKAKLAATKNLRIKGKVEQPEPTRCKENPFLLQRICAVLTRWSTKP